MSIYTFFNLGGWNGIHLHIFDILGAEWDPLTHISHLGAGDGVRLHIFQIWDPGMVSIYTYFNSGAWKWGPFTHISNLGPRMVSI